MNQLIRKKKHQKKKCNKILLCIKKLNEIKNKSQESEEEEEEEEENQKPKF